MTSKVSSIEKKKNNCPYCAAAPSAKHPDFTCPRIESVTLEGESTVVGFIEPDKWEKVKQELGLG